MFLERALAVLVVMSGASFSFAANVPEGLKPSANETLSLQSKATGVQIYTCSARKDDPYRYEWTFTAPEAELYALGGSRIGRHYGGPTWESNDGSKVVGEVKGRDRGPDANAIPWLLLTAKSSSGNGVFSGTTSVQRLDTTGGKAPADGCDAGQAGKEARVPYTATYVFFSAK
ncbi:MAG: DUF3455 domain-containing protein [Steroidobacterales bacterium]